MNTIFPDGFDELPAAFAAEPLSGVLFAEDFDDPAPGAIVIEAMQEAESPLVIPSFTADDLDAARREGYEAGLREARAATAAARESDRLAALERIATGLAETRAAALAATEAAAEGVATLMLRMISRMLPALSAAYGEQEVRSLLRSLTPVLSCEPEAAIRVHPSHVAGVTEELEEIDMTGGARIELIAMPNLALGDVRITWRAGGAKRDAATIRAAIDEALDSVGLLSPPPAAEKKQAAPASVAMGLKEIEHVG